ncbi:MAG: hypothetical protein HC883_05670 [Bdellovibrionaceae bacterium]|nr:hypothetical protein [Pseudobdellovibrionaceae bacterium]
MFIAEGKWLGSLLLISLALSSAAGNGAICYRSKPDVRIDGRSTPFTVNVLWNRDADVVDEILVEGKKLRASADLFCSDAPPISCTLGEDGGTLLLVFTENRLKILGNGVFKISRDESGESFLSVQAGKGTRVVELEAIPDADCRGLFPERKTIEVFPEDNQTEPGTR